MIGIIRHPLTESDHKASEQEKESEKRIKNVGKMYPKTEKSLVHLYRGEI